MKNVTKGKNIKSDLGVLTWTVADCPNDNNEHYVLESSIAGIVIRAYYMNKVILVDAPFILRSHRVMTCKSLQNGLGKIEHWLKEEFDALNRLSSEYVKLFEELKNDGTFLGRKET